jgi:hypothetical protein
MKNKTLRTGHCACSSVHYELTETPLIVHACHCSNCQRVSGSAFAINIWIEAKHVNLTQGELSSKILAAGDGSDHEVFFCSGCGTYLWSNYHRAPGENLFVRAGTLENPEEVEPDVHIFVRSKVPWLELPADAVSFDAYYDMKTVWPSDSLDRFQRNM